MLPLRIPFDWICAVCALIVVFGLLWIRRVHREIIQRTGTESRCQRCGYSMSGLNVPRCPECGTLRGFSAPMNQFGVFESDLTTDPTTSRGRTRLELFRVILPVHDIDTAARFYGAVLGQPGRRVSPGRHYFRCGGAILACYCPHADGDEGGDWRMHENQYLYFAVADLESAHERVRSAGARCVDEAIATMPWGERLFYANDPFGNPICFVDERTKFTGEAVP